MKHLSTVAVIVLLAVIALNLISMNDQHRAERLIDSYQELPTPTCGPVFYAGPCH